MYDLASVTKVAATALMAMHLYEAKKYRVADKLYRKLKLDRKSPLRNLTMRQLLTHKTKLQPNMPITRYILHKDSIETNCNTYVCDKDSFPYTAQVMDAMYFNQNYHDTIWKETYMLKPLRRRSHLYSDVNFMLLQRILEETAKQDLTTYTNENFYNTLDLRHCRFRPMDGYDQRTIIPTAIDTVWRKQLVHGYVHDETAAIFGGIAGNAGLFGNAEDLVVIFQMLLNGGQYAGHTLLKPATINYFTTALRGESRGLCFDKSGPTCSAKASKATYGHSGFTGTCVWVDPKENLIYIFLSNRVYPDVNNRLLMRNSVRRRIHNVVYRELPK